jgi:hypothetical protein
MPPRIFAAAAAVALLAGCTTPVQLQYPDGRIVQCGSSMTPAGSVYAALEQPREAQCIHDHMAQGARRL